MSKDEKIAKILLIIFGGVIFLTSSGSCLLNYYFYLVEMPATNHNIILIVLQFISTIIGLAYFFLGINIGKIPKRKLQIHVILSLLLIVWYFSLMFLAKPNPGLPSGLGTGNIGLFDTIIYYVWSVVAFFIILIPQLIIAKKLNKTEKKDMDTPLPKTSDDEDN